MNRTITHIKPGIPAHEGQLILQRRHRIVVSASAGSSGIGQSNGWGRLLDIGCGNGAQTALFVPEADQTVGLDITPLDTRDGVINDERFHFVCGSAMTLPFRSGSFDHIMAFEVLEHLPDDRKAVAEIGRVLRDGGLFIFSVPNRWWLFETHGAVVPGFNWVPWNRLPLISWLPSWLHNRIAMARIYTMKMALKLMYQEGFEPLEYGYITAPLDVLPDGRLRKWLRWMVFTSDTTRNPLLAVNLYVVARKQ